MIDGRTVAILPPVAALVRDRRRQAGIGLAPAAIRGSSKLLQDTGASAGNVPRLPRVVRVDPGRLCPA